MIENDIAFQRLERENCFIQPMNDLMSRHVERKDELLKEIFNDYLEKDIFNCGMFDPISDDIRKLSMIHYGNGSVIYLFDGVPIVEFFLPTLNTENMKVTMSANYRKLYEKRR